MQCSVVRPCLFSCVGLHSVSLCFASGGSSSEVFGHLEAQTRVATQRLYRRIAQSPSMLRLFKSSPTGYLISPSVRDFTAAVRSLLELKSSGVDNEPRAVISPEAYRQILARNQQMQTDIDLLSTEVCPRLRVFSDVIVGVDPLRH
jgi:hypothetical protein